VIGVEAPDPTGFIRRTDRIFFKPRTMVAKSVHHPLTHPARTMCHTQDRGSELASRPSAPTLLDLRIANGPSVVGGPSPISQYAHSRQVPERVMDGRTGEPPAKQAAGMRW
jgi:hypothetical protein